MAARVRVSQAPGAQTVLSLHCPSLPALLGFVVCLRPLLLAHVSAITAKLKIKDVKSIQTSVLTICVQASLFIIIPCSYSSGILLLRFLLLPCEESLMPKVPDYY